MLQMCCFLFQFDYNFIYQTNVTLRVIDESTQVRTEPIMSHLKEGKDLWETWGYSV